MAEEKKKNIPIEDGTGAEEEVKAEAEAERAEKAEEKASDDAGKRAEAEAEEAKESKEAKEVKEDGEASGEAAEDAGEKAEEPEKEASAEEQESERYMRLMAEFQNFKRRAAKEKTDIHAFANERIVSDLLPVLDNFERALGGEAEATENEELKNYAKGMELIFEQLKAALEKAGVKEIEALGEDFDPNVHNAVMTEQTDEYEDGKISKVMQKGYKLNDRVVRPAMVAVNKK